jgi:hypothetical protein
VTLPDAFRVDSNPETFSKSQDVLSGRTRPG